jgi:hypothetical protein
VPDYIVALGSLRSLPVLNLKPVANYRRTSVSLTEIKCGKLNFAG